MARPRALPPGIRRRGRGYVYDWCDVTGRGGQPVLTTTRTAAAMAAVVAAVVTGCNGPFRATGRVSSITAEQICVDPRPPDGLRCYALEERSPPAGHVHVGDCVELVAMLESARVTELRVLPSSECPAPRHG